MVEAVDGEKEGACCGGFGDFKYGKHLSEASGGGLDLICFWFFICVLFSRVCFASLEFCFLGFGFKFLFVISIFLPKKSLAIIVPCWGHYLPSE